MSEECSRKISHLRLKVENVRKYMREKRARETESRFVSNHSKK